MPRPLRLGRFVFGLLVFIAIASVRPDGLAPQAPETPRVLLVSIDGLGDDILDRRDELGLEIPTLRALIEQGAHADFMRTVTPAVSSPSHVSMVTGVPPATHGISANGPFVPEPTVDRSYIFASEVDVPTLFDRAAEVGLKTAAVWWPLTAGGPIDLNLPAITGTEDTTTARHLFLHTRGPVPEVLQSPEELVEVTDEERLRVALRFLREKPRFMAVHLSAVDEARHDAPEAWNQEAVDSLETTDRRIGRLLEELEAQGAADETTVLVVSDHGLTGVSQALFPNALLRTLGLIDFDEGGQVEAWRAMAYSAVGSAAIRIHPDATAEDTTTVDRALAFLAAHPQHGLREVLTGDDARSWGGFPDAYAILTAQPEYVIIGAAVDVGDTPRTKLRLDPQPQGQHGHDPQLRPMHAVLIATGPGVPAGRRLPAVSILDIAPTVAAILGLEDLGGPGQVLSFTGGESPGSPE